MNGEWTILLWILVGVVFLMKIAPVRSIVSKVRQQPLIIQTVAVLALCLAIINGSTKTNSQNSALSSTNNSSFIIENSLLSSGMPTWWNDDDTDTDDDGIPDLWEKWTHGNRYVEDSAIDRDEDGLTDLEEFQNQTDPRTADTDGDGFSDAFEVANGMNPTTAEDFTPVEPDADNNGRIDLWEDAPYIYGFNDADHDGFDDIYELYFLESASDGNFDVVVDVYTTRSAVLTWNGGLDGIVVLPTTGQTIRLRLPFDADTELKLMPAPEGISSPESGGLWKAKLALTFLPRASQSARGSCIIASNGDISQKVVDTEKTITRFPDEEEFMQTLSLDAGQDDRLKIYVIQRRFAIVPELQYFHSVGDSLGPFSITNTVNIDVANVEWRASHGTMSPTTGSSSFLTVTRLPDENQAIIVTAEVELDEITSAQETAEVRLCPRNGFSLDSYTANFSPHLGETNTFSVTLSGCMHQNDSGWLEVEIMRETTSGWQHVAWVDMDSSTEAIDRYGNTGLLPSHPEFVWDGYAQNSLSLADHPDEFTGPKGSFHRAMPEIVSGEPVPPPFYSLAVRRWNSGKTQVMDMEERRILVPQVVRIDCGSPIAEMLSKAVYSDTPSNIVLFSGCSFEEAEQVLATLPVAVMQFVPDSVNIRIVYNQEVAGAYKYIGFSESSSSQTKRGEASDVISRNHQANGMAFMYMYQHSKTIINRYSWMTGGGSDSFEVPITKEKYVELLATSIVHETGHLLGLVDKLYFDVDEKTQYHNKVRTGRKIMDAGGLYRLYDCFAPNQTNYWMPQNLNYMNFVLPKGN